MADEALRALERAATNGGPGETAHYLAALVRAERHVEALELLLGLWRRSRDPLLAGAIDLVSERIPVKPEPTNGALSERIDALASRPEDPRLALALARVVEALRPEVVGSPAVWTTLFDLLVKLADVRTLPIFLSANERFWQAEPPRSQALVRFHDGVQGLETAVRKSARSFEAAQDTALARAISAVLAGGGCRLCAALPAHRVLEDYQNLLLCYAVLRPWEHEKDIERDQDFSCRGCDAVFRRTYRETMVIPDEAALGPETLREWVVERLARPGASE